MGMTIKEEWVREIRRNAKLAVANELCESTRERADTSLAAEMRREKKRLRIEAMIASEDGWLHSPMWLKISEWAWKDAHPGQRILVSDIPIGYVLDSDVRAIWDKSALEEVARLRAARS